MAEWLWRERGQIKSRLKTFTKQFLTKKNNPRELLLRLTIPPCLAFGMVIFSFASSIISLLIPLIVADDNTV